jgi:predicted nucleic-acid-binding Zn-ribbon protein
MTQNQPAQYASCPKCGSTNATKVGFTWWGGALGPVLFTHVKCSNCKTEYNGKTGKSNTNSIIIYSVVMFAIVICLCILINIPVYLNR